MKVAQIIFGYRYARVDRHLSVYYVMEEDGHIPTIAPPMERGETVLLFLTQDDSVFGLDDANLVITDGDEAWGKFAVRDGRVTTLHPARGESQPTGRSDRHGSRRRVSLSPSPVCWRERYPASMRVTPPPFVSWI